MVRTFALLLTLVLVNVACSQQRQDIDNCALHAARKLQGQALLVTGVESEGRLNLVVFKDRCTERLANVYFAPDALLDIESYLNSLPGREFDDVKVAILDAKVSDDSEPIFAGTGGPILIDSVYRMQPFDQQTTKKKPPVR